MSSVRSLERGRTRGEGARVGFRLKSREGNQLILSSLDDN